MKLPPFTRAVCDKLKIVFHADDVTGDIAKDIIDVLNDLLASESATKLSSQGKAYRKRYRVPLNDDDALLVEIDPNRPDHQRWAMTWEWNPSHLGKADRLRLIELSRELLGSRHRRLLTRCAVSLVHLAVDFPVAISTVAMEARDKQASSSWGKFFDARGNLESQYFGSAGTGDQFIAYDKEAERIAVYAKKLMRTLSKVPASSTAKLPKSEGERLRLEDRQRLTKCPVPLHRLSDLREPFAGFYVYSLNDADARLKDPVGRLVLALARAVGLQPALKLLDKVERERVRRALARCHSDWWDRTQYVNAVTTALQRTGVFPDEAFDADTQAEQQHDLRYQKMKSGGDDAFRDLDEDTGVPEDEQDGED